MSTIQGPTCTCTTNTGGRFGCAVHNPLWPGVVEMPDGGEYPPEVKKALGDMADNARRWKNRAHRERYQRKLAVDQNERLRAVLLDLAAAFAFEGEGGIHFEAQPVAYRREQIRKALDG